MGWGVKQSTESINGLLNLASISMLDLGTTADIVTDTMTPFANDLKRAGDEAKKAGQNFNEADYMVDIFAQTSAVSNTNVELMGQTIQYAGGAVASMGGKFEDLAIAIGAMANAGIKGTKAGTGLATGLSRLNAPTDKAKALMKQYGIELVKTKDGNLDLLGTMNNLRKGFANMSATQKDAVAKEIFGQTAKKAWIPIINAESDAWDKLTKSIQNSEGASKKMMEEIQNSGAYQFKQLSSAIEELLITIGDALAPAIKDVVANITDFTIKLTDWVKHMKETNPELLSMIGKFAMMAVVIPPVIALFGGVVGGIGKIFSTTGMAIGGLANFTKQVQMVSTGVMATDAKVGIFAKGLGGLVAKFGAVPLAVAGASTALVGIATVIGQNENALSWLIDKWGWFGEKVAQACESISGWVKISLGNVIILIGGVGQAMMKLMNGEWTQIDDVFAETWAKVENNTAEALSDINMESSYALQRLRDMTGEQLGELENKFQQTSQLLPEIFKGGVDNIKTHSEELAKVFQGTSDEMLANMRGTSDTMAVLLEGITENMSLDKVQSKLEANLESMIKSGKYSADTMASDFKKASDLINKNFSLSLGKVKKDASLFTDDISKITSRGVEEVANNIENHMNSMNKGTFEHIKTMGNTWKQLFDGVEQNSGNANAKIVENLKNMGGDSAKIIKALNDEIKGGMKDAQLEAEKTGETAEKSAQKTANSMAKMVNEVNKANSKNLKEHSNTISDALKDLDAKSIQQLKSTSNEWYTILDGATDNGGKLVGNFKDQIMWNLNWVAQQSPEKMKGFTNGMLDALVKNNIITKEQMEEFKKNVNANVTEASKKTEESTKNISESLANMMKALNDQTSTNLGQLANTISTALGTLDKESIAKLSSTSQQWSIILKGAVTDGGTLSDNYQKIILENITKVSKESPEKMNEFKTGLLQALVGANIITQEQMNAFAKTVSGKTDEAKQSSKGAGDEIAKNVAPNEAQQKTQQELDKVNQSIQGATANLQQSSKEAGAKSSDAFASEVNKVKEKVKINDSIINIQELENQMKGSGTLAITAFAQGWVENTNILVNGINTSITQANSSVITAVGSLNTVVDGVATKMAILSDRSTDVTNKMSALNNMGLGNLKGNVDGLVNSLSTLSSKADEAKGKIVGLVNTPELGGMASKVQNVTNKIIELGNKASASANSVRTLASTSLSNLLSALKDCINRFKDIKSNADKVKGAFDKIIAQSFRKLDGELKSINDKLTTAKSRADSAKSAIQKINEVSMSRVISQLSSLKSWLSNVRSDAYSTANALDSVNSKRSFFSSMVSSIKGAFSARAVEPMNQALPVMGEMVNYQTPIFSQDSVNIANYKTSGGYYSPKSVAGRTTESIARSSDRETIELLKRNQEILMEILLAEREVKVDLNVDSKQIARATAKEMNKEISIMNKRKERLGGRF